MTSSGDEIVYLLTGGKGKAVLEQGVNHLWGNDLLVREREVGTGPGRYRKVSVYAEGSVRVEIGMKTRFMDTLVAEMETDRPLEMAPGVRTEDFRAASPIYERAMKAWGTPLPETRREPAAIGTIVDPNIRPAQFARPPDPVPSADPLPASPATPGIASDPNAPPIAGNLSIQMPDATINVPIQSRGRPRVTFGSRFATRFQASGSQINGESVSVITGGIRIQADFERNGRNSIDIVADEAVVWNGKNDGSDLLSPGTNGEQSDYEVFLSGNVEIRYASPKPLSGVGGNQTLRADQVYFDISKNKAIARNASLQFARTGVPQPIQVKAREIQQLSLNEFNTLETEISASKLPSNPGLKLTLAEATIIQRKVVRRNVFGIPFLQRTTGLVTEESETTFDGKNVQVQVGDLPVFYLPRYSGEVDRPFGPLQSVGFRQDRIFGSQIYSSFNMFDLLALRAMSGETWNLNLDYLSQRGPAIGTNYNYSTPRTLADPYATRGQIYGYAIQDMGQDVLAGTRSFEYVPTTWRSRGLWQHNQELPDDYTLQFQVAYLSDKNFLESYFKNVFDNAPNQETFLFLKQNTGNWYGSILAQANLERDWINETQWLPRADGALVGLSFFDMLTYNVRGSAGYAETKQTKVAPPALLPTEAQIQTGRFDVTQDLSAPVDVGPVRVVPYGKLDLTYYTRDLTGEDRGRFYLGGGVKANVQLSQLFPDVDSDLLNLRGLYHKIDFRANYFASHSDTPFGQLPQLDRLYDDSTDLARRELFPFQQFYLKPAQALALTTSPIFNPQVYAIRRLTSTAVDTLDSVQVVELGINQRLQTKRGFPGSEHTVDWLTLDTSISAFPDASRDNFGKPFAFLEYDANWFVGDQTGFNSSGWFDPFASGIRYYSLGAFLNRPDRTDYFLSYQQLDPIGSRLLSGGIGYMFSEKYSFRTSIAYDFGTDLGLSYGFALTRTGTDVQVSLGVNYSQVLNNFGVTFEIIPTLLAAKSGGRAGFSPGSALGGQR